MITECTISEQSHETVRDLREHQSEEKLSPPSHLSPDCARREEIVRNVVMNQRDKYGNTALHLAAWNNGKMAFRCLLEAKADPVLLSYFIHINVAGGSCV